MVYTHHTTCSVMLKAASLDETYNGVGFIDQDLWDVLEQIIPTCRKEGQYLHPGEKATRFAAEHGEDKPEALNTEGHLRSSLLKRSVSMAVAAGRLDLGAHGRICLADFDQTRSRERQAAVCVIGVQNARDSGGTVPPCLSDV